MTELRISLLIAAIIIIAAMYVWYRANAKEDLHQNTPIRDDDDVDDRIDELPHFDKHDDNELLPDDLRSEFQNVSQELRQETIAKRVKESKVARAEAQRNIQDSAAEMLIIFHVVARSPEKFSGPMIARMMDELELEHGDMGAYHYNIERFNHKQSMYCIVNMLKPGTLNPSEMDTFSTRGITLIMRLPGPEDGLKAFNIMVEHAQRLAAYLNGDLLGEQRNPLTKQTISMYKEKVQLFSLRATNKAAAG